MHNRLHVGKVGMARYQKWRCSLLIRGDVGLEKNNRLGTMHTSDHRISVWYKSFTPSSEVLRRLLKKNNDNENSKIAYERFLVWRDDGTVHVKKN